MIHGMRIKDGKATYVSRYVKTSRLKQEEYFGGAKFMKVHLCNYLSSWKSSLKSAEQMLLKIQVLCLSLSHFQIGDLKGLFGLLMVNMQQLRAKLKVVDLSYGHGTSMFSSTVNNFSKTHCSRLPTSIFYTRTIPKTFTMHHLAALWLMPLLQL